MANIGRRSFLRAGYLSLAGLENLTSREGLVRDNAGVGWKPYPTPPGFKLGMVTYELGKDWDIETIIKNCEATGFEGVELRTTHRHTVEPSISKSRRDEVRKRFEDSRLRLVSLGTTCEYESPDPAIVERNVEETRRFSELAHDLGCLGVKVRPNGFPSAVPQDKTLDQIGQALHKCGDAARDLGVEVWLECHGEGTQLLPNIHRIMEVADHPSVGICWNSNPTDVVNGSVKSGFELLKPWLRSCHITELWDKEYPYQELFSLFRGVSYNRYTFAEIPASCEPLRLMRYYRALWEYQAGRG